MIAWIIGVSFTKLLEGIKTLF